MKIAFVLDDTLDSTDGVQQYVLLVGSWLREQGHEVHYLAGQTKRTDVPNVRSLTKNVRVRFNKNRLSIPLPARVDALRQLLHDEAFDVIHVQMPYSPFLSARIITNVPDDTVVVGTFHIAPHSRTVSASTRGLGVVLKSSLKRIDEVVSVSLVAQQFAKRTFKIDSTVIPNAIDVSAWKPTTKTKSERRQIVFLGRLVERKGCIYFLKACRELYDEGLLTGVDIVIAGDGPDRKKLEHFVRDSSLRSHVTFRGFVSEAEKKQLLQTAYLGVFPATGGESFGIVLLEAMAAGTVAVAGNNPGYLSVIGGIEEVVVVPDDTKQFTDQLRRLLLDDERYRAAKRQQSALVKQYDINTVGSDILKLYKRAQQHRSSHGK